MRKAFFMLALAFIPLAAQAGYEGHPKAEALLDRLASEFAFGDADIARVRAALVQAERLPQLIAAEQNAAERAETWSAYAAKRVDPVRIERGAAFLHEHQIWFDRAEADYGVPREVIAGVLGLETSFGRVTGKARVLDSLATQGFDHPTRSAFFFGELVQFFVFCRERGIDPVGPMGSYAGAMGWAQFMPSSYRRLAVDYDQDGRVDLWSAPDAIGSVAAYLTHYDPRRAWRRGEAVMLPARLTGGATSLPTNTKLPALTAMDLASAGVRLDTELAPDTSVGLIELTLDQGKEYWVGLHNFYAVMSYNPRVYYAMTVARLAEEMARHEADSAAAAIR